MRVELETSGLKWRGYRILNYHPITTIQSKRLRSQEVNLKLLIKDKEDAYYPIGPLMVTKIFPFLWEGGECYIGMLSTLDLLINLNSSQKVPFLRFSTPKGV